MIDNKVSVAEKAVVAYRVRFGATVLTTPEAPVPCAPKALGAGAGAGLVGSPVAELARERGCPVVKAGREEACPKIPPPLPNAGVGFATPKAPNPGAGAGAAPNVPKAGAGPAAGAAPKAPNPGAGAGAAPNGPKAGAGPAAGAGAALNDPNVGGCFVGAKDSGGADGAGAEPPKIPLPLNDRPAPAAGVKRPVFPPPNGVIGVAPNPVGVAPFTAGVEKRPPPLGRKGVCEFITL